MSLGFSNPAIWSKRPLIICRCHYMYVGGAGALCGWTVFLKTEKPTYDLLNHHNWPSRCLDGFPPVQFPVVCLLLESCHKAILKAITCLLLILSSRFPKWFHLVLVSLVGKPPQGTCGRVWDEDGRDPGHSAGELSAPWAQNAQKSIYKIAPFFVFPELKRVM